MDAEELTKWVAAGTALIAFLVALRMQVVEPLIRALRDNTSATYTSSDAQTSNATATAANTAVVAGTSAGAVTVNVAPAETPPPTPLRPR